MMLNLERHWYQRSLTWLTFLLLPFSWLFRAIVQFRRFLYKHHLIKMHHFPVPVIVIGNITVGGTGKTPLVIWLAQFLKAQQWRPGIVSRGVGGKKQKIPLWVDKHSKPDSVGDEALLLAQQSTCPVVVCVDRVAAVKELLRHTDCNIILSDDGLQHYRLGRRIEIAVWDGDRTFGNGHMLPAGPLREAPDRLKQVDFIVQQGGAIRQSHFSLQLEGNELISLFNPRHTLPFSQLKQTKVHAVAGIGNPDRFFSLLRNRGLDIVEHVFPDHYFYQQKDFNFSDTFPIVMTAKDKVKCENFADERFWYLPVTAVLDEAFGTNLLLKL